MFENLMSKIENFDFTNRTKALQEVEKTYKRGMLTKEEYIDAYDYACFVYDNKGVSKQYLSCLY